MADIKRNNDAATAGSEGSGDAIAIHTPALHSSSTMVTGEKANSTSASSIKIEFEGPDDSLSPLNLQQWQKWLYAHIVGSLSLVVTFAT
jgi:hypothetical protein